MIKKPDISDYIDDPNFPRDYIKDMDIYEQDIKELIINVLDWASMNGDVGELGDQWWNNKIDSEELYNEYLKDQNK